MRAFDAALLGASSLFASCLANPVPRNADSCQVTQGYNVSSVIAKGAAVASQSYDFGYHAQALIEFYNPKLSVFYDYAFPSGKPPTTNGTERGLVYARRYITTGLTTLANGGNNSGSPATLGVPAILLGQNNAVYMTAAQKQADYLVNSVERLYEGAISTLTNTAEAWDEWIMNAPPFLAYYAAATGNTTLLNYTVSQIGLYRGLLQTSSSGGCWQHVDSLAVDDDTGLWGEGQGLVAYGIAQVLAVVDHWGPAEGFGGTKSTLISWAKEVIDCSMNPRERVSGLSSAAVVRIKQDDQGLIVNYFNNGDYFGEVTATALLAAAVYRLAVLAPETFGSSYLTWADVSRGAINGHVYSDGTLSPAVNPSNSYDRVPWSQGNPTGQSAGVFMAAAYRDCRCAGICS